MKFFDKWLYRKVRWCCHRAGIAYPDIKAEQDFMDDAADLQRSTIGSKIRCEDVTTSDNSSNIELERPIRFTVAAAEGGMIIEVSTYDQKNDRRITKHHIISDEIDDKAAAIAKIVSWEFLRRPQ